MQIVQPRTIIEPGHDAYERRATWRRDIRVLAGDNLVQKLARTMFAIWTAAARVRSVENDRRIQQRQALGRDGRKVNGHGNFSSLEP
jgi:hypothetical protein